MSEIKASINNAQVIGELLEMNLEEITKEVTLKGTNGDVKIVVQNNSKKGFKSALIKETGEFSESTDINSTPYIVKADQLPKESNIIGVKNFSKYN